MYSDFDTIFALRVILAVSGIAVVLFYNAFLDTKSAWTRPLPITKLYRQSFHSYYQATAEVYS